MAERKPLGIPLERHRKFAPALMRLDLLAPTLKRAGKLCRLCGKLRYELDEHVFIEFTQLPEQERMEIYYTPAKDFDPNKGNLDELFPVIDELSHALADYAPDTLACKLAQELRQEAEKWVGQ